MERKFAQRCRELMLTAWSADVQEQLRLWAEELDRKRTRWSASQRGKDLSHPRASAPSRRHRTPATAKNWFAFGLAASGRPPTTAPFCPTTCNGSRRAMARSFEFRPANANFSAANSMLWVPHSRRSIVSTGSCQLGPRVSSILNTSRPALPVKHIGWAGDAGQALLHRN